MHIGKFIHAKYLYLPDIGGQKFVLITNISFMSWVQFAKGILIANKYYSVFNLSVTQRICLSPVSTFSEVFLVLSDAWRLASVKLPSLKHLRLLSTL